MARTYSLPTTSLAAIARLWRQYGVSRSGRLWGAHRAADWNACSVP